MDYIWNYFWAKSMWNVTKEHSQQGTHLWIINMIVLSALMGTAVAQWLRYCAKNRKVAVSIPDGVMEFFTDIILPIAL